MRAGFSLSEVLVGSFILALLIVPFYSFFLFSTGGVGQDVREVEATGLALEVMEQVANLHRRQGRLAPLPSSNATSLGAEDEIDLDAHLAGTPPEVGAVLFTGTQSMSRVSRLFLSTRREGFRRYLGIALEAVGQNRPGFSTRTLWKVNVRVRFVTPVPGGQRAKDIVLTSYFHEEPVYTGS